MPTDVGTLHGKPSPNPTRWPSLFIDGEKTALSSDQLIPRLIKWLKLIKEPQEEYSLHSLKRIGVTFAYQCDIKVEMIKKLGDWASDAYKRYIDAKHDSMKASVKGLNKVIKP